MFLFFLVFNFGHLFSDGPHSPNREPPRGDDFYPPTRLDRDGYFSDHEIDGRVQREDDDNFTRQFHDEYVLQEITLLLL